MDSRSALDLCLEASIVRTCKNDLIIIFMQTVNNVINGAVEVIAYVVAFFLLNVLGKLQNKRKLYASKYIFEA